MVNSMRVPVTFSPSMIRSPSEVGEGSGFVLGLQPSAAFPAGGAAYCMMTPACGGGGSAVVVDMMTTGGATPTPVPRGAVSVGVMTVERIVVATRGGAPRGVPPVAGPSATLLVALNVTTLPAAI